MHLLLLFSNRLQTVLFSVLIIIRYYVTITDINKYDVITDKVVGRE